MAEYKYKAFISYRHIEPDMQAAEKLQKLLESYKPPKNIGKKKENWRIFRDVSELQSSSDLSEDIKNAIETSEYLIVICSPKYTESKWCLQELSRFRELHNNSNDNIITLLVSGEPKDSFPEELTYREMTTVNENGEEVKVKVEVEPLAANIKADTLKESMKKLNTEYLRIAAPLLGCDFNDLFQREKRREAARRRRVFGAVSGVLSVITGISVVSALTINSKNVQIKKQNEEIAIKNNNLLIENAGHLAVESENLFKENSLIPAIKKAVEALPGDDDKKPVLTEAEYALSRELGMFSHRQIVPQVALKHECSVEQLSFMGEGESIVSEDASGIYFWEAGTGKLIKKITASDDDFSSEAKGSSNKLTAILDIDREKTGTVFKSSGTPSSITYEESSVFNKIYTDFEHDVKDEEPGTGGDVYVYNSDCSVWRLDGATGEIKWTAEPSEKAYEYKTVLKDGKYILRIYLDKSEVVSGVSFLGKKVILEMIDCESGNCVDEIDMSAASDGTGSLLANNTIECINGDVLYMYDNYESQIRVFRIKDHALTPVNEVEAGDESYGTFRNACVRKVGDDMLTITSNIYDLDRKTEIRCFDSELKNEKWTATIPINFKNGGDIFLFKSEDTNYKSDVLAVVTASSISFIDHSEGRLIKNIPLEKQIIDHSFIKSGIVTFTLDDGSEYLASLSNYTGDTSKNAVFRVQKMNGSFTLCSYSRGRYATAENYSNTAYIQFMTNNEFYSDIDAGENMYSREIKAVSDDGEAAALSATFYPNGESGSSVKVVDHFFIYDIDDKKLTDISELEGFKVKAAEFIGNDTLIAAVLEDLAPQPELVKIDVRSGDVTKLENVPELNKSAVDVKKGDGGVFLLTNASHNVTFVSADGNVESWEADSGSNDEYEVVDNIYAVCGKKAAIYASRREDGERSVQIFEPGKNVVTLNTGLDADSGLSAVHLFWLNEKEVGVLYNNRTVCIYNSETGESDREIKLTGIPEEPISAEPLDSDSFAVLCRDSCIYSVRHDTVSGSTRLEFADEYDNDIRESDSSSAYKFRIQPAFDPKYVYAVWDDSTAWLIDINGFKPRYRVDSFTKAPLNRDIVFIRDRLTNNIGYFPIYTTKQLLDTAKKYLSGITEG